mgnify:CR=1 FL=1
MKTITKTEFIDTANNYIKSLNLMGIEGENSILIMQGFVKGLELQLFNDNGTLTDGQNAFNK